MTDKEKLDAVRAEIHRLVDVRGYDREMANDLFAFMDSFPNEPVSEDLGDYIYELSKQFPEVSFAKLSRIAVRVAKWQKENLWKPADGEDLPEYDREVIALTQPYPNDDEHLRVVFAHRPNKYAKVWNSDLGEEQVIEIEGYDKGGWNIQNVKYWLDCLMPKEVEL